MDILLFLGALSVFMWLGILLHPVRPWDFQPVGEDILPSFESGEAEKSDNWPSVCVLVPARNEAEALPNTLPALLTQEYPGQLTIIVVDDRSEDGTAEVAHRISRELRQELRMEHRLTVLSGAGLPHDWVGKVWALEQAAAVCGVESPEAAFLHQHQGRGRLPAPDYLLLTDADILHTPRSLWRLVAESEQHGLALNSRMARLRCISVAEQLLIPAFVFFFNLLYPMRWVNQPSRRTAACAGGCVLLARSALEKMGGFASIKGEIIDDVNLARQMKDRQLPIRLALSRHDVTSLRTYDGLASIWIMVRRTAFTELRYSVLRLLGTVLGLGLLFLLPPICMLLGIGCTALGYAQGSIQHSVLLAAAGGSALIVMAGVYRPAVGFFGLPSKWMWTLPLAGTLYGAMTIDSALRYWTGKRIGWRDS